MSQSLLTVIDEVRVELRKQIKAVNCGTNGIIVSSTNDIGFKTLEMMTTDFNLMSLE